MAKFKITAEVDTELKTGTVTGIEEIVAPPPSPPPPPPPPSTLLPPKLGAPANGAANVPIPVQILAYIKGPPFSYRLQVATEPTFSSPVVDSPVAWPYTYDLSAGTVFYYRMKTLDASGNESAWSDAWSFTTAPGTPPPPPPPPPPAPPSPPPTPPPTDRGLTSTKLFDAQTVLGANMAYLGWVRHDAESADGTKLLVQSTKSPAGHLFNALPPYLKIMDMPYMIMASWDPDFRWPKDDSSFLYVTYAAKFAKYDYTKGAITDLHDFQKDFPALPIARVYAKEGGNPSMDDRYWAWCVRCVDAGGKDWVDSLLVYDTETDSIVSQLLSTDPKFRSPLFIGISPLGDYVLVDVGDVGMAVYPRDFSSMKLIPCAVPYSSVHAFPGVGLDDTGKEVIVWVEKYPAFSDYWVVMADLATGTKTYLVPFGSAPNFNASAIMYNKPGWAVISNSATGEIFIVQLTKNANPKLWKIAQTKNVRVDHNDDLFAKPNKKGTKVFYRSNNGTPSSAGGITNPYEIDLPTDWDKTLLGQVPSPAIYAIDDTVFHGLPSGERPPKGVPWIDPNFHVEIVRITDAPTDVHSVYASGFNQAWAGYPKHDAENCDGSMMIMQSQRQPLYHIWNTKPPYNKIKDFPSNIGAATDADPRWDPVDPDVLYYTCGTQLLKWQVTPNVLTVVHDFKTELPDLLYVSTREEGTPSEDGRYWAFLGYIANFVLQYHICYDKQTDTFTYIDSTSPLFCPGANNLSMSPSGKWVMDMNSNSIWPRDFSSKRILGGGESHGDFAYDKMGREVIISGYQRYSPAGADWGRWARMIDLETGETFWPAPAPGAQHVSGNSYLKPGWALFSIMTPFYPEPPSNWFDHAIYMIELVRRKDTTPTDHGRVWMLYNAPNVRKNYSDDVYGKLNKKGTKVWFSSSWNQSSEDPGAQIDCYQINLPPNWWEDLG